MARSLASGLGFVRFDGYPYLGWPPLYPWLVSLGVDAGLEAMQAAGMSPGAVLVAATRNGAMMLGRSGELGTLELGKLADLLILGADPSEDISNMRSLEMVLRAGEVVVRH